MSLFWANTPTGHILYRKITGLTETPQTQIEFTFRGEWDDATAYENGDVVQRSGVTYLARADSTGIDPTPGVDPEGAVLPGPAYWEAASDVNTIGMTVSAGTSSGHLSALNFSNSNGVSFGLSGSTLTGSIAPTIAVSAGATSGNLSSIVFSNSNGVSFGLTGSTITGSVVPASPAVTLYATGNTTQSSSGTSNASSLIFNGAGNVSVGITNGSILISGGTAAPSPVVVSAGTSTASLSQIVFGDSNGVSFGLNGSTITGSIATSLTNINISAGATSHNLSNLVFSNSNGVSFGLTGSTITGSVSAGGVTISSYENVPLLSSQTQSVAATAPAVSVAVAFQMPNNISASFIRLPVSMSAVSTGLTTAVGTMAASAELYSTWNMVVYSLGTGASSKSLIWVTSSSAGWTFQNSISVGTNGSAQSISQRISGLAEGSQIVTTTQYSQTSAAYGFVASILHTLFSGNRFMDLNFANSLSAGPYWLVFGVSTNSSADSVRVSAATANRVNYVNHMGVAYPNSNFGIMGNANLTTGGLLGAGSFSTVGGGTTSGFDISAISSSASNFHPYFQMLRSA